MLVLRKAATIVLVGADLTTGYYSDWATYTASQLQEYPEVKGPLDIINMGEPGWTSVQAAAAAATVAALRADFVLIDTFALTDSFLVGGNPQVSQANHTANLTTLVNAIKAANPAVKVALLTMSPVTAARAASYPNLAAYYAADSALAGTLGVDLIDNYAGTTQAPAGWPKPLTELNTYPTTPFNFVKTPGFFGQVAAAGIDGAHIPGNAAVNGNVVTGNGSPAGFVRGNTAIATPTQFEVGVTGDTKVSPMVGVCFAGANPAAQIGSDVNSIGIRPGGTVMTAGAVVGQLSAIPTTATYRVGMEVDPANKLAWFMFSGVRQGPFDISAMVALGAIYPAWNPYAAGGQAALQFSENCDGIHPVWAGMQDTYVFPAVIAYLRAKLGALWP